MKGYQFARMESYSVQGAPGKKFREPKFRKSGERAWTAQEVLDEAERKPWASFHVNPGGKPPQILPGTVSSFAAARAAHEEASMLKEVYVRKGKKAKRKLRSDARTLYSSVVSLPTLTMDALADPELQEECVALLAAAMEHERKTVEKAGGVLLMGVIHWDEDHVHAHYLAIEPQLGRVDTLHPGRAAKIVFNESHAAEKVKDPKAVGQGANRAYRAAMSKWQDDFYEGVFDGAGLLRFGPKRCRMTRAEYQKALAVKDRQAKDEKRRAECAATFNEQVTAIEGEKIDLLLRETEAARLAAQGQAGITRAEELASSVADRAEALECGMSAIEARQIDYRPATEKRREGLEFGPKAPDAEEDRRSLKERIMPAFDLLVGFARRVFGVRQREEAQEATAAELRRRAAVVEATMSQSRQVVPESLAALAAGEPRPLDAEGFPGAWSIPSDADAAALRKRLEVTTNLELRAAYQATRDAMLLTEEDVALRAGYVRGVKVIEMNAAERGFDLETGRQDVENATDPKVAALHTDQFQEPIKVLRVSPEHVRTRT